MDERSKAEEHLRVIRSLMEKATVYRAISAETALVAGVLSILASIFSLALLEKGFPLDVRAFHDTTPPAPFLWIWLVVLALTLASNTLFVWRRAKRRQDPFVSPGMKLALRSVAPTAIAAAALTFFRVHSPLNLAIFWTLFYGLALLSTGNYAPRSIIGLGWAFLSVGTTALILNPQSLVTGLYGDYLPTVIMALTFGFFHLIYAACTWPRQSRASE